MADDENFKRIMAGLTEVLEIAEGRAEPARPPAAESGEGARFDADNPEWTDDMFARARPPEEVLSPEVLAAFKRPRGRPKAERPKVAIKLRLDAEVVEHFKAAGPGWQTRMNEVLAQAVHLGGKT